MPASLEHVHPDTPMGATLVADGATFRVWAPNASAVHVVGDFNGDRRSARSLLTAIGGGHWAGFVPGVKDRHRYMFHVTGPGGSGRKRDPYARELDRPFPGRCIVRAPDFPWHDTGWRTPPFEDFVLYQLHVGSFFAPRLPTCGTFLDVARKIPHLVTLGATAIQLLPIQEFHTTFSQGYNGTDYFSPEMDFGVADADLAPYVAAVNALLDARALPRYAADDLRGEMNQLKALVDLCHAHGIAVVLDVVYNHAGGDWGTPNESIYFFDHQTGEGVDNRRSLYFTDRGHAGGLVFDYAKPEVRDFLIQNAAFFLREYRVDGLRYDQVSVIARDGAPRGWDFCQDLTSTLRFRHPGALHKAEFWNEPPHPTYGSVNPDVVAPPPAGAGFDTTLTDGLRIAIRDVIASAREPDERPLGMERLGRALWPVGFREHWRFVQGPENHDVVYHDREMRVARLGHPDDPRSWYGRSRARVATAIGLTAPGIPMLFMGQELLADRPWADDIRQHPDLLLDWAALDGDAQMRDHLRFTSDLLALRRQEPALRGQGFHVIWSHDADRVLAFQRWVEGEGRDVVVVVHLATSSRAGYRIGFPGGGPWRELFNSDVYDRFPNPDVVGNGGRVTAEPLPLHGLSHSAALVLPGNAVLVFGR